MANDVIVDAGPLVALLDKRDASHHWAVTQLTPRDHLLTAEAVISEALFLVRGADIATETLLGLIESDILLPVFRLLDSQDHLIELMRKYADVPISLADASLICLSESYPAATLLTTDSDFRIYRRFRNEQIPALFPPGR